MLRGIHKLCDKANWDETRILLRKGYARSASSQSGGWGDWTPLHLACKRDPPEDVILDLIEAAPSALEKFDVYSRLPIHYAVESGLSIEILYALFNACPSSIRATDSEGRTPLHLSLTMSGKPASPQQKHQRAYPSVEEVQILLDTDGVIAKTFDNNGNLPLHYVCDNINNFSEEIVRILVKSYAPSVIEGNEAGLIPLHQVLKVSERSYPTASLVKLLVDDEGVVARTLDDDGNLPLHYFCNNANSNSEEVIRIMVKACPPTVLEKNSNGYTPLHQVILNSNVRPPTLELVKLLMAVSEVATVEDIDGHLPLHCACRVSLSCHVLLEILNGCTDATSIQSRDGRYPLEILEEQRDNIYTDDELSDFNVKSDMLFAHNPNILPYQTDSERLGRIGMQICSDISEIGALSETSLLVWTWMCAFPDENDPESLYSSLIANIITCVGVSHARILASLKSIEGTPIHQVAAPKTSRFLKSYLHFADNYEFESCPPLEKTPTSLTLHAKDFREKREGDGNRVHHNHYHDDVVIKFMIDRAEYEREIRLHSQIVLSRFHKTPVVPILNTYDMDRIGKQKETAGDLAFARDIEEQAELGLSQYRYACVKPKIGDSLHSLIQNDSSALDIKKCLYHVGSALKCLHDNGIFYGEIGMTSIVTMGSSFVFSDLTTATSSTKDFYGARFSSGFLPPEMIMKLNSKKSLSRYDAYWKTVIEDAKTFKLLFDDDILFISDQVNSFLSSERDENCSTFMILWNRIISNSTLWKKIQPQLFNESSYVIKCLKIDEITGIPYPHLKLPYKLVRSSESFDAWMFGLLLYELCSGEALFPVNKRNDLVNGEDIAQIHDWDNNSSYAAKKYAKIDDPIARDLLRELLVPENRRPRLNDALEHPFFYSGDRADKAFKQISLDIVRREEIEARKLKEKEQRKREYVRGKRIKDNWLREHTSTISQITHDTSLKMDCSTWNQWKTIYPKLKESICPTAFVILPYKLASSKGDISIVSDRERERACRFGILLASVTNAATLASEISQHSQSEREKANNELKVNEYTNMNKAALAYAEINVVDICQGIIIRARNAENILCDILSGMVTNPESVANILVCDKLENIVNISACQEVASKARDTGKAFNVLIRDDALDHNKISKQLVNEKYESLLGSDFCSESISHKINVERALFGLIKDFVEDPATASKEILKVKTEELINLLLVSKKLYFYLLDEMTNAPVYSQHYPCTIECSSATLRILVPSMRVCLKSSCVTNMAYGLATLVGIKKGNIPVKWKKINLYSAGKFDPATITNEFNIFQEVINEICHISESDKPEKNIFQQYVEHLSKFDPNSDYGNLHRIFGPNGLVVWTTLEEKEEIIWRYNCSQKEFISRKIVDEIKSLDDLWGDAIERSDEGLNIWCNNDLIAVGNKKAASINTNSIFFTCMDKKLPPVKPTSEKISLRSDSAPSSFNICVNNQILAKSNKLINLTPSNTISQLLSRNLELLERREKKFSSALSMMHSTPFARCRKEKKSPSCSHRSFKKSKGRDKDDKRLSLMAKSTPSEYIQKLSSISSESRIRVQSTFVFKATPPLKHEGIPHNSINQKWHEDKEFINGNKSFEKALQSEVSVAMQNLRIGKSPPPMRKLCGSVEFHEKLIADNFEAINILDSPTRGTTPIQNGNSFPITYDNRMEKENFSHGGMNIVNSSRHNLQAESLQNFHQQMKQACDVGNIISDQHMMGASNSSYIYE